MTDTGASRRRRALVIGAGGQDGFYLTRSLERDGCAVTAMTRAGARGPDVSRAGDLLSDGDAMASLLRDGAFDEAYYLAAHHHSAETLPPGDGDLLQRSIAVHAIGFGHLLEGVRLHSPQTRIFYAASSHLFGDPAESPQSETTPFAPDCIYGMTKLLGVHAARFYRARHGLHCSVGILYNHESPRRGPQFLSRKVVQAAREIAAGRTEPLVLGDLDAIVDWGYAADYVEAMKAMLDLPVPGDYVVASGRASTVRDWVRESFAAVGLDWRPHVQVDPAILAKAQTRRPRVGTSARLREATGWTARTDLPELVRLMIAADDHVLSPPTKGPR